MNLELMVFKQTYFIILYIIVLLSALALVFASIITGQNIVMTLMGIVITIIVSTYIYSMIKNRKFSLEVKNKNIKIFYNFFYKYLYIMLFSLQYSLSHRLYAYEIFYVIIEITLQLEELYENN